MEQCLDRPQPQRRNWVFRIGAALALRKSRAQLARLDARLLRDIGVSDDTRQRELARPLWDVPPYFRKI